MANTAKILKTNAKGIHNGLNIHHQDQSILSNILAKKNKANKTKLVGVTNLIVMPLLSFSISFYIVRIFITIPKNVFRVI